MTDQQTNLLLVMEVEKHPILYNFRLSGYSNKQETENAWAEVGDIVKLTATECKERWRNIRAVFARHLKNPKSGSGIKEKKAYYLSDALQFIAPYIKVLGKPSGSLCQPPPEEEEEGPAFLGNDENDGDDLLPETPLPSPPASQPPSYTSSARYTQDQDRHTETIEQDNLPNRKKRPAKFDDVDEAFMEYLNRKNTSCLAKREMLAEEPRKEALKMFLLSFLPDLMKMDEWEVRQFKRKTLDVVDGILSARAPSSSCHR